MKIWLISITIVILILIMLYILLKINKRIRKFVYEFFLKAEYIFKSGEGNEKMNYVISNLYFYIPNLLKIFISKELLRIIIQSMFEDIKDFLDDGEKNNSVKGDN